RLRELDAAVLGERRRGLRDEDARDLEQLAVQLRRVRSGRRAGPEVHRRQGRDRRAGQVEHLVEIDPHGSTYEMLIGRPNGIRGSAPSGRATLRTRPFTSHGPYPTASAAGLNE